MENEYKKFKVKALRLDSARPDSTKLAKQGFERGFSLLEVMLVVLILSVSLVVFIQVISRSIDHSLESRDVIIASGLAQEGVELVKNKRDNNWAKKRPAFEDIDAAPSNYIANYDTGISQGGPVALKINSEGYYASSGATPTKFSRKIYIENDGANKKITSYVIWERGVNFPNLGDCYVLNRCVYATITLTQWGGE